MKLSSKEDRNTKYTRRNFIKKAVFGMPILFSPQYVAYNLLESRNNEKLLYRYGVFDIDPSLTWIDGSNNTLLYSHPADVKSYPLHAMPVGNGSIGAMFEGHPEYERIIINHCKLRPVFYGETERDVSDYLPLVRKLFLEGNYKAAQATFDKMQSENGGKRKLNNYHQVCDLILEMDQITTATEYKRLLDLQYGVGKVSFNNEGTDYIKTYYTSFPDDLFVVNLAASKPESVSCTIALGRIPYKSCLLDASVKGNSMILNGKYAEGTCFEVSVTLINQGGNIKPEIRSYSGIGEENKTRGGKLVSLSVLKADELTILTNVRVFNELSNEEILFKKSIPRASDNKKLLTNHIQDFRDKISRVSLKLTKEQDSKDELPFADQLLEQAKNKNVPPKLFELIFQIGRYALLSCSRSGGLPSNLQGLWSNGYSPAWNCRYQLDMNLQMCYWLANPVNLDECNLPLFDYLEKLVSAAIKRSKDLYNCRGISLPVGVDEHNVRYPSNSETQCVAGWMARHFWEHYLFTSDKEFLIKRAYPFMLKAGEFFEDFLYESKKGKYVILPSSSPENHPRNFPGRLSMNATIDLAVAKELFNNLIKASHILGLDGQKRKIWHKIVKRLPAWPVGGDGTLLEWADRNAIESQKHRHLSHLYPLYPGSLFDIEEAPELVASAVKAIRKREAAFLEDACGWSYTWLVALYARAGMAEDAYRNLVVYAKGFVTADNFLSTISDLSGLGLGRTRHGKLIQVEAGLGITAAIAEMLLQSHNGLIRILPALPKCWDEGSVKGLKARGNYEIDIIWKSGYTDKVILKSKSESVCRIKFYRDFKGEMKFRTNDKKDFNAQLEKNSNNIFVFKTEINAEYEFYAD